VIEVPSSVRLDPPSHPSWPYRRGTDEFPVTKNNNAASARDELRRAVLRAAEELAPQWETMTELEEEAEERRLREEEDWGASSRSWRDDERDDKMFELAGRKLLNERVLRYLDNQPQIGRPTSDQWYDDLLTECLNDAGRIGRKVRDLFFERAKERRGVEDPKNQWAQAMKRHSHSA
jgi:hypothetical protein